jgi:hypothetical protein
VGAEAVLIDRTSSDGTMRSSPTRGVGGSKPVHKPTEGPGFLGLAKQMPVVGHDAEGEDGDRKSFHRLTENLYDLAVFEGGLKQGSLTSRSVAEV